MVTKILGLTLTLCITASFATADTTRLVCRIGGETGNMASPGKHINFEFDNAQLDPATSVVIGKITIIRNAGTPVQTFSSNAKLTVRFSDSPTNNLISSLSADCGRSGQMTVDITDALKNIAEMKGSLFDPDFNLPGGSAATCMTIAHIGPKPAVSGSN